LQYVLPVQAWQMLMALPLLSRVLTDWNPSAQKQSEGCDELAFEVQFMGHALLMPPEHQNPGRQGWQGWLLTPEKPALQKHDCGLEPCGADTAFAVQFWRLPPMQYEFAGHCWQLVEGP
jgi:hypothetical protein